MATPSFIIGIEEEYQIIDPATGELRSYITELLEAGKVVLKEQVKAELHQSIVEVGTHVCNTPAEARAEIIRLRRGVMELAGKNGLKIAAAGRVDAVAPLLPIDQTEEKRLDQHILAGANGVERVDNVVRRLAVAVRERAARDWRGILPEREGRCMPGECGKRGEGSCRTGSLEDRSAGKGPVESVHRGPPHPQK